LPSSVSISFPVMFGIVRLLSFKPVDLQLERMRLRRHGVE
jgi:hypothetical protein